MYYANLEYIVVSSLDIIVALVSPIEQLLLEWKELAK